MRVLRALFFSFWLHALLILGLIWLVPHFEKPPQEVIEVRFDDEGAILEALTPNKQQIVREALAPEKLKAPDDETLARFLSEQKQRVQEQQRAAKTGMTANRDNNGPEENKPSRNAGQNSQQKEKLPPAKDGFRDVDITQELQEMNRAGGGYSTVGEALPQDVKVGSFTALNTDRYLYYTFYARMEELIRYRWESRVQDAINSFDRNMIMNTRNRNWVTSVEFLLDKDGLLKSALIMKESGVRSFDLAAVNAFKEARIFPNPPQGMIQEDGMIHIKFSFTVNFNPPTLVNRN